MRAASGRAHGGEHGGARVGGPAHAARRAVRTFSAGAGRCARIQDQQPGQGLDAPIDKSIGKIRVPPVCLILDFIDDIFYTSVHACLYALIAALSI